MGMLLYHLLGTVLILAALPLLPFFPAWRRGLGERLGRDGAAGGGGDPGELIWVHGASVGEVLAAVPLLHALRRERPAARLLVSTMTWSGRAVAEAKLAHLGEAVRFRLLPLDWDGIPARLLAREEPALFVLLETELWPVLLRALRRRRTPVLLANGRISAHSFGRYRMGRWLLRPLLGVISTACVRTREDAARFEALGLPAERIRIVGNLKHDLPAPAGDGRVPALRRRLGPEARQVLVAGSLRGAEAGAVLEAFSRLRERRDDLLLVLAPRHPERFDPAVLGEWEMPWERWSAVGPGEVREDTRVLLLDTLGELADFYGAAAAAFVGGTLEPRGGHNLFEPARHGVPVLFGPHFGNFADEGEALLAGGGGRVVRDAAELHGAWSALLADEPARAEQGRRAGATAASFGGALARTLVAVGEILGGSGTRPAAGAR